jgi:hypothetical protein
LTLEQRVSEVLLPAVLGIARPERRVDPARRHARVCVAMAALAEHEAVDAVAGELDRGAQPRRARADDEDLRADPFQ